LSGGIGFVIAGVTEMNMVAATVRIITATTAKRRAVGCTKPPFSTVSATLGAMFSLSLDCQVWRRLIGRAEESL